MPGSGLCCCQKARPVCCKQPMLGPAQHLIGIGRSMNPNRPCASCSSSRRYMNDVVSCRSWSRQTGLCQLLHQQRLVATSSIAYCPRRPDATGIGSAAELRPGALPASRASLWRAGRQHSGCSSGLSPGHRRWAQGAAPREPPGLLCCTLHGSPGCRRRCLLASPSFVSASYWLHHPCCMLSRHHCCLFAYLTNWRADVASAHLHPAAAEALPLQTKESAGTPHAA